MELFYWGYMSYAYETVSISFMDKHEELFLETVERMDANGWESDGGVPSLKTYTVQQVSDRSIEDFLDTLLEAGIAYDAAYVSKYSDDRWVTHWRFTDDGLLVDKVTYENDNFLEVVELMHLINDEKALTDYILKAYKNLYVIPWDKQDEYGKIFQMKQLIDA